MARPSFALAVCVLAIGCDGNGFGLGRSETFCTIENCHYDQAFLRGALPKSADQPLAFAVESCSDGLCSEAEGECAARAASCGPEDVQLSGGCEPSDVPCTDPDLWHVSFGFGARTRDAGLVASASIRVVDTDTGAVLVDERFEPEYKMSAPTKCDANDDHLTCLSFVGTWPARHPDGGL